MIRILMAFVLASVMTVGVASAESKIGVANMQVVGSQSEANKKASEKYTAEFNKKSEELTKKKKAFEQKVSTFMAQRPTMGKKLAEERGVSLTKEEQTLRDEDMKFQQRVNAIQNSIAQELAMLAFDASATVAKEKGLDLIVSQNGTLYHAEALDVTNDVITALNALWKEGGSKMLGEAAAKAFDEQNAKTAPKKAPAKKK